MKKLFNGKAKNFLATLLCLCMVVAMIPAAPSAQAADVVSAKFTSANTALQTYTYGMQGSAGASSYAAYTLTAGKWMAFTMGSFPAGEYTADFKYTASTAGAKADIYVVPCGGMDLAGNAYNEVSNAIKNNASVGNVSFYTSGNSTTGNSFKFDLKVEETGDYLLIARVTELSPTPLQSGNYAFNYIYPESLTLTVPDKYVSSMDISFAQGSFSPSTTLNGVQGAGDSYGYRVNAFGNANRNYVETLFLASNVDSAWMAFDLGYITGSKLNEGKYDLTFKYQESAASPIMDVYLVEMDDVMDNWYNDLKNIPANNTALGQAVMGGQVGGAKEVVFENIDLDGGNYVLFLKPTMAAPVDINYVYISGVKIAPTPNKISEMNISFAQGDFEPTTTRNGYTGEGDCYGYNINAFGNAGRNYIETLFVASNVNSAWMAFDLGYITNAKLNAGKYDLTFKYMELASSPVMDVYLVEMDDVMDNWYNDLKSIPANNTAIGQAVMGGQVGGAKEVVFEDIELDGGNYVLFLKPVVAAPSNYNYVCINGLSLTPSPNKISEFDISFAQGEFTPSTTTASIQGAGDSYGYGVNPFSNENRDYVETLFVASNVANAWMAFDLGYITNAKLLAGTYSLTLNYAAFASSPVADIYLVEMDDVQDNWYNDLKSIPANNTALGRVTMTGESGESSAVTFDNIELDGGNYVLFIKPVEAVETSNARNYVGIEGVSLKPYVAPQYEQGDVNGDGKLNTRDVTTLRRYLAGGYEDSITFVPEMIDVNGDGRENTRDVAALRAIIAG